MNQQPTERSSSLTWYYLRGEQTCGPVDGEELRAMFDSGQLVEETLVWHQGMPNWLPARETGLYRRSEEPIPPPIAKGPSAVPSAERVKRGPPRDPRSDTGVTVRTRGRRVNTQLRAWGITAALSIVAVSILAAYAILCDRPSKRLVESRSASEQHKAGKNLEYSNRGKMMGGAPTDSDGSPSSQLVENNGGSTSVSGTPPAESLFKRAADDKSRTDEASVGATSESAGTATPEALGSAKRVPTDLYQEIVVHKRPSFELATASMVQDFKYAILSRLTRQAANEDGLFQVTLRVLDTRLDRAEELTRASYVAALEKLVGAQYIFTLNATGQVTRFDGFESSLAAVPVEFSGSEGFQMTQVLDKDGWIEVMERSMLEPARHIAPGQTWTRPMQHDFSPLGRWSGTTTFSQDTSREPPLLYFKYKYEMEFTPGRGADLGLPFRVSDVKFELVNAEGTFAYDPDAQHVTQVDETFHVKGSLGTELLEGIAGLEMQERQTWSIRLSQQNPWDSR